MIFGHKKRLINRLLIVEDEPLIAFDNEIFLQNADYEIVATVNSAEDALVILDKRHDKIDAIVLDYNLAGAATGRDVAELAATKKIKVLFVTGNCPDGVEHLAVGCLMKPYTQKQLLVSLEAVERISAGKKPKNIPDTLKLFTQHQV